VNLNGAATFNGTSLFKPTDHIFVYSQTGNDSIVLRKSGNLYITVPAFLYGGGTGKDNDFLDASGSKANNVLTGGGGKNNTFSGGSGRDLLIAGLAASTLNAGGGEDVLIGGWTDYDLTGTAMTYDRKVQALEAIMSEWARTDLGTASDPTGYLARVNDLLGPGAGGTAGGENGSYYLNGMTVHGSGVSDILSGASGSLLDWFLASGPDVLKNKRTGEVVTTLS
jgi:hypothetical protein